MNTDELETCPFKQKTFTTEPLCERDCALNMEGVCAIVALTVVLEGIYRKLN